MKHIVAAALVSMAIASPSSAQRLVDPTKVAPEFREAAEKRRAEQIKQQECARKADEVESLAERAVQLAFGDERIAALVLSQELIGKKVWTK